MAEPDIIDVVEATYALELSPREWLEHLAATIDAQLGRGVGTAVFLTELGPHGIEYPLHCSANMDPAVFALGDATLRNAPVDHIEMRFDPARAAPIAAVSQYYGDTVLENAAWRELMRSHGLRDGLTLAAIGPSGGIGVSVPARERLTVSAAERTRWAMVTAHMAAGYRLRSALGELTLDTADAVLEPDGTLVHAQGAARRSDHREALRLATQSLDRARGRLRREDPDSALALWQGLFAGHYSLVDHFDSDGRRFVVVRKNEPDVRDPRALTRRERQVAFYAALGHSNKLIGYTLGLSASTVGTYVGAVMRKLGLRSRAELASLFGQVVDAALTPGPSP